jgi:hypothetical protein
MDTPVAATRKKPNATRSNALISADLDIGSQFPCTKMRHLENR